MSGSAGNAALLDQIGKLGRAIEESKRRKKIRETAKLGARKGSKNRTLVVERGVHVAEPVGKIEAESGEGSRSAAQTPMASSSISAEVPTANEWVRRSGRHLQLVKASGYNQDEAVKLKAIKASRDAALVAKMQRLARRKERLQWRKEATAAKRRIIFNGVLFERDPTGRKLVQKEILDVPSSSASASTSVAAPVLKSAATPRSVIIDGTRYLRSKRGNLIPARLVRQYENRSVGHANLGGPMNKTVRRTSSGKRLCVFYTRYGQCKRGEECPYLHDREKRSLCPRFMKQTCPHMAKPEDCALSHEADQFRTPHCRDFASDQSCRRTPNCPYPHVTLGAASKVCRDFAVLGYCADGLRCTKRHVKECPDFAEKGECLNSKCHLPHVARQALPVAAEPLQNSPLTGGLIATYAADKRKKLEPSQLGREQDFILFADDDELDEPETFTAEEGRDDASFISFGDIDSDEMLSDNSDEKEDDALLSE